MEYFPLVDKNDNVIGKIGSDEHVTDYKQIRFANAILYKGNKIIVPKRTMTKKLYPGCYDYSGGGHVNYGESYLEAIVREMKEELGIDISNENIVEINTYIKEHYIQKVYYLKKDIDKKDIRTQEDEVEYVKWLSKEKINELIENNQFRESNIEGYKCIINNIKL